MKEENHEECGKFPITGNNIICYCNQQRGGIVHAVGKIGNKSTAYTEIAKRYANYAKQDPRRTRQSS